MQTRFTFGYGERLHLQKDFKRVFKTGRKLAHPALFIYIEPKTGSAPKSRLGLVTSGKLGNAVQRNRLKRRLREIFRLHKHAFSPPLDIIFVPRMGACKLSFDSLKNAALGLLEKAGVYKI
jgi:ribonuclease P protein component